MAALVFVLAAPMGAQTISLKANVPFDFAVGGLTMPAGDYVISSVLTSVCLEVRNASSGATPTFTTSNAAYGPSQGAGAFLTFNRYGNDYFLATIWDGAAAKGRAIPMSRTEQEKANSASLGKPEVVLVLARR